MCASIAGYPLAGVFDDAHGQHLLVCVKDVELCDAQARLVVDVVDV